MIPSGHRKPKRGTPRRRRKPTQRILQIRAFLPIPTTLRSSFVGISSAMAEWSDAHPQLGEGMAGYGRYYWRGFVDKTEATISSFLRCRPFFIRQRY
jgi:hypothetical protein